MNLKDIFEFARFMAGAVAASFAIAFFVGLMLYPAVVWECSNYAEATGKETKVKYLTCYVKTKDGWYDKDQVRSVD